MVGETLSHYRVIAPLGAGGMGELFVAEDVRLGRQVALKLLPPALAGDRVSRARLEREARALARLQHPAIVTIHEVGEDREILFLVMELVRGERLDERIARTEIEVPQILETATTIAAALAAAHEVGVIHRDLKPSNVMLTRDGVKVLDFGLAVLRQQATHPAEAETLTASGIVAGTLTYMAPEQLRGMEPDPRSDLFSFGVLLYEMTTGHRPFRGASSADVTTAILRHDPPPVTAIRETVPADLARIVRHCLQKDPDRRYQTAKGLRNELVELAESLRAGSSAPAVSAPVAEPPKRRRLWSGMALATAVAGALLAAALLTGGHAGKRVSNPSELVENAEARALLAQAERYESRGDTPSDLELAEQVLRRALEKDPGNPYLEARLAALLARVQENYPRQARRDEIEALTERALAADPEMVPALIALGQLALMRGDWQEAEATARRILERQPSAHQGYGILGRALLGQGRTAEAVQEASRALDQDHADPWARLGLARVLLGAGRLNEAAVQYERVLEVTPDSPNALSNLGTIYGMTGRDVAAIPLYTRLLQLKDDDAAASNLGAVLYNLGRFEEAVEAFGRAHRIKPDHPTHQRNLADAYEAMGDREQSTAWLERSIAAYDDAIDAGGPQPQLLAERAVAAAKLGRHQAARADIARAIDQGPTDPLTLYHAAQVAALVGDEAELLDAMERALRAGFPREPFHSDPAFGAYRESPRFTGLLFEPSV